jgi:hypothetical protein
MSSHYPSKPYSNSPAYSPVRPNCAPNYGPQVSSFATSGPYMPTTQYRIDAHGRQQRPGPAPPYRGNGIGPSQHGHQQRLPGRTVQPYNPSGQYQQDVNTSPDSTYAPAMTRGSSSGSYGTDSDSPQSHSSLEGSKE